MSDKELKIIAFDLIRHYIRNFENDNMTDSEKGNYVKGVVDLYTEIRETKENEVTKGVEEYE